MGKKINLSKEILEYWYEELGSLQKVADKLDLSVDSVRKYCDLYGVEYSKKYLGKYSCKEDLFEGDSPESFYLAGFVAADGSVQHRKYSKILKIALSTKDREHLEKIREMLGSNHPIKEYGVKPSELVKGEFSCVELQIVNRRIVDGLSRFGIVPNKTSSYQMPDWLIEHPLIRYFLSGYFDGDGSLSYSGLMPGRQIRQLTWSLLGNKRFLGQARIILAEKCQVNLAKISRHGSVWRISFCGNLVVEKIDSYLRNQFRLNRKLNRNCN